MKPCPKSPSEFITEFSWLGSLLNTIARDAVLGHTEGKSYRKLAGLGSSDGFACSLPLFMVTLRLCSLPSTVLQGGVSTRQPDQSTTCFHMCPTVWLLLTEVPWCHLTHFPCIAYKLTITRVLKDHTLWYDTSLINPFNKLFLSIFHVPG